ncbi:rhodanese-like domain-containing protein, partial [Clostridium perfringens]|uniref:rhodanese-like domain-containing protein n=1 Tax=Clostridium perfringens TaxID=1502 RepID=UPI003218FDE2
ENLKKRFSKLSNEIYYMIKSYKELGIEIEDYGEFSLNDEENLFLEIMKILYIEENFIDFDIKIYNYNKNIEKFKDELVLVYCRSGKRSAEAVDILKENGFKNLVHMKDGISKWDGEVEK